MDIEVRGCSRIINSPCVLICVDVGYAPLIKTYVSFILAKLRFHRLRPEFNGLFEYEEYVTLKGIDDPNEGYVYTFSCASLLMRR